jgi:hypothetical protein
MHLIWIVVIASVFEVLTFAQDRPAIATPKNSGDRVSYAKDVEPILQMHCASCHHYRSEWWPPQELAGGLDLTSYETLVKGGNHGHVIIAGQPDSSLMIKRVIENDDVRMPFLSPPLSTQQIDTLRTWIAQGATKDDSVAPSYTLEVDTVSKPSNGSVSVSCRVLEEAFLGVEIIDPKTQHDLLKKYATAKWSRGYADKAPGEWITWTIYWGEDWPQVVTVRLRLSDLRKDPLGTVFVLNNGQDLAGALGQIDFLPNPVSPQKDHTGTFKFSVEESSNLSLDIKRDRQTIFTDSRTDIPHGSRYYKWNLRRNNGQPVPVGSYEAVLRFKSVESHQDTAIAVFFSVVP